MIGADIMFNDGALTSQVIACFYDVLKEHHDRINKERDLANMAFGC